MLFTDDYLKKKKKLHTLKHYKWTSLQYNVRMDIKRLPPSCNLSRTHWSHPHLTLIFYTFTKNESGVWFPACFTLWLCGRVAAGSPVSLQTSTDTHWVSGAAHLCAPLCILTFFIISQTKSDLLTSFDPLTNTITDAHSYAPGPAQSWRTNDAILQPQRIS